MILIGKRWKMVIRRANENDVPTLNNFLTLLIQDERQYDPGVDENFVVTNMYDYIDDESKLILVALEENQIVGYLYGIIKPMDGTYKYKVAKLDALYVEEPYRNLGIASALIEQFKAWTIEQNARKVEVNVWSKNTKAKTLYEKANFKPGSETLILENF